MSRTITGHQSHLVTLTGGANPATIAHGAVLQYGLYGASGTAWTVTNYGAVYNTGTLFAMTLASGGTLSNASGGVISASSGVEIYGHAGTVKNAGQITATAGIGVSLADGGIVSNQTGGYITSSLNGVVVSGAVGTVTNSGIILAGSKAVYLNKGGQVSNLVGGTLSGFVGVKFASSDPGTVSNAGDIYGTNNGIYLRDGGTVTNQANGTISSAARGVYVKGFGAGTVINAGTIGGTTAAVRFNAGYAQRLIVDPGAVFIGGVYGGNGIGSVTVSTLELASGTAAGTFAGLGSQFVGFARVSIDSGATWTLSGDTIASGYVLTDGGTLTNTGSLGSAVTLTSGAMLSNASTGTISSSSPASVYGTGTSGSTVINSGTILATNKAVYLKKGGQVTNLAGGTLSGAIGVKFASGNAGTVTNAGFIYGTSSGIYLRSGGMVTNLAGGTISGVASGVFVNGNGAGTVTNAGLISGATAAVRFNAGYAQRLIVDPGAVFIGGVYGGNSIGSATVSTLELASGTAAGSLAGLGSQFVGFARVSIDSGATWTLSSDTIAPGYTVVDSGTIVNSGAGAAVTLSGGLLDNAASGWIVSTGAEAIYGTGTVINAGLISGPVSAVEFIAGSANLLVVDPGAAFSGMVDGGNTIGSTIASTLEFAAGWVGTLTPGAEYVNFGSILIDSGASLTLTSLASLASGYLLTDAGTLTNGASLGLAVTVTNGGLLSNTSSGTISSTATASVYGTGTAVNTVINAGLIINTVASGSGVRLIEGGLLTNQSGGVITGYSYGAYLQTNAPGTVANSGSIGDTGTSGTGVRLSGGGLVSNQSGGTIGGATYGIWLTSKPGSVVNRGVVTASGGIGVDVKRGGYVANQSGGVIAGNRDGVYVGVSASATVINSASISGTGTSGTGARLSGGGLVSNQLGGSISGATYGILLTSTSGSVVNAGVVIASNGIGVAVKQGGYVANQSGGTIAGNQYGAYIGVNASGTVINSGSISAGGTDGKGVRLSGGGLVSNQSGGNISGTVYGVWLTSKPGTVINAGSIAATGTAGFGVYLKQGGYVSNQSAGVIGGETDGVKFVNAWVTVVNVGSIVARGTAGDGVYAAYGGFVTNQSGGTIAGANGVVMTGAGSDLVNAGLLTATGTAGAGVLVTAGGIGVTNQAGGTISGVTGIHVANRFSDTVINAGLISASSFAVAFQPGNAGRLIFDPGASFIGTVSGGNMAGSSVVSTLELGSGSTAGTLAGLGSQFIDFAHISIDSGATWTLSRDTITSGYAVTNFGTLTNSGTYAAVTLSSGLLSNAASGSIVSTVAEAIYGTGTIINAGLISGPVAAVEFLPGSANRLIIDPGASFVGVVNGGNIVGSSFVSPLELASGTSTGTLVSLGSQYIGFAQVTIDSGATWALSGDTIASGYTVVNFGTLTNSGTNAAVTLGAGGLLSNAASGSIVSTGLEAVYGAGTVIDAGLISGPVFAVEFAAGSANHLVIDPGASFVGQVDGGNTIGSATVSVLEFASGTSTGTLVSLGSQFINFAQVTIDAGARWTLSNDTIASGSTLMNFGTLTNGGTGAVLTLGSGGLLNNATSGSIVSDGAEAVYAAAAGTVANYGHVIDTAFGAVGVLLHEGGRVTNQSGGTIAGNQYGVYVAVSASGAVINSGSIIADGTAGSGLRLSGGGLVSNQSGGSIAGTQYGVWLTSNPGTVINAGSIAATGTGSFGVYLKRGGFVTNQSTGAISGGRYGIKFVAATQVVNAGIIDATGTTGDGLEIAGGGGVTNLSTGTIAGANGVVLGYLGSMLTNAGLIAGTGAGGTGIVVSGNGISVTNQSGGMVSGATGIYLAAGSTLVNAGLISASGDAVQFTAGGADRLIVDPGASFIGTVSGGNTIGSGTNSTLELGTGSSGGTLSGLGTQFIDFARIKIDSGAAWTLTGSTSLISGINLNNAGTLNLSDGTLTDAGTLTNNGAILIDPASLIVGGLSGTGSVTIGSASTFTATGSVAAGETIVFADNTGVLQLQPSGGMFSGTIDGFVTGDTITLDGVGDTTGISVVNGNTLAVTSTSLGTIDLALNPEQSLSGATFFAPVEDGNTIITADNLACFAEGTRIDTPRGPVAVEALRPGDLVLTASGAVRPVRWIGWRRLNPRQHPRPWRAQPIRILAHAIAPLVPRRDVLLSPDHAVMLDGVLIIVRQLVNHATIRQEDVARVTYYHVELDSHDVLLAEGMPVESYLDTGNRGMFENATPAVLLHPFQENSHARRVAESCVPFVDDAAAVEPVWTRIAERAVERGYSMPKPPEVTHDPALHMVTGGRPVMPLIVQEQRFIFVLPALSGEIRLCSRHMLANLWRPWLSDNRRLGVMVRQIVLRRGSDVLQVALDDPALARGWWPAERQGPAQWRWTDGDAQLPLPEGGPGVLEISVGDFLAYPVDRRATDAAAQLPGVCDDRLLGWATGGSITAPNQANGQAFGTGRDPRRAPASRERMPPPPGRARSG